MGAFILTHLAPPPPNETVLARDGSSLWFVALYRGRWITVPDGHAMKHPPTEWFDRDADAQSEEIRPPARILYGKGQMTFDF